MTMIDWKADIARVAYWKQLAADHDKLNAMPWKLPRVGAKCEAIAEAERELGHRLPAQYRQFLEFADGWQGFFVTTDLFGTDDFILHRHQAVMQNLEVQAYIAANTWRPEEVTPIGATDFDLDKFLLIADSAKVLPGGVAWFTGQEVDRYPSFHDFFAAMVNYNARLANQLVREDSELASS
jgi:cell wall assembly regulator SMI1